MKFKIFKTLLATTMLLAAVESSAIIIPLDSVSGNWEGSCYDCATPINQPTGWDYEAVTFEFSFGIPGLGLEFDAPGNVSLLGDGSHSYSVSYTHLRAHET